MKVILHNLKISHIIAGLPQKKLSVFDYEKSFGLENIKHIARFTGIEELHVAENGLCASDYHVMLAKRLMQEAGWTGKDFDGILFVSLSPDYVSPATSIILQSRIGMPTTTVAFDINSGCAGFVLGLYQAALLVASRSCNRVLICNGDTKVRMTNELDHTTRLVLGDGFSLAVMECGTDEMAFNLNTDGSNYDCIIMEAGGFRVPSSEKTKKPVCDERGIVYWPEYIRMDGLRLMEFVLQHVPEMLEETLAYAGWERDEVGTYALHQANRFMLKAIAEKMNIPMDCMPITLKHCGNTASASVPLMLTMKHRELAEQKKLSRTLIAGFGVGLSWGAVTANLSKTKIYDTLEL